ncbi:MAG: hypothetical protein U5L96_17045 [Owenweeksia sp.]|nr:hypothetical protein [Owenweeksia sp.]
MQIEIEQKYKRYGTDTWFPEQLNARLLLGNVSINGATPVANMRTYLKNVKIGNVLKKKNLSRAKVTITDDAVTDAPEILAQYRIDSLTEQENYTYHFMISQ